MSVNQIYEGWKNKLFPPAALKELISKTGEERLSICENCRHHSKHHSSVRLDVHCTHCGCTLSAKTKCLSCSCPIGKWGQVVTQEQEKEMGNE